MNMSFIEGYIHRQTPREGDYEANGLLMCGTCRQPREMHLSLLNQDRIVPITCDCDKEREAEQDALLKRTQNAEMVAQMRRDGLTDAMYEKYRFDGDDRANPRISDMAKRYVEKFDELEGNGQGIMFYGNVGTGKSFLAGCIANALLDKGVSVLMTTARTLISEMNKDYGENRADVIRKVQNVRLLVLDDIGVERDTEYATEQLYEVINERYKSGRPMIITTNLTPSMMQNESDFGKVRIFERITEMCAPVQLKGESRRKQIAMNKRQQMLQILGLV